METESKTGISLTGLFDEKDVHVPNDDHNEVERREPEYYAQV